MAIVYDSINSCLFILNTMYLVLREISSSRYHRVEATSQSVRKVKELASLMHWAGQGRAGVHPAKGRAVFSRRPSFWGASRFLIPTFIKKID